MVATSTVHKMSLVSGAGPQVVVHETPREAAAYVASLLVSQVQRKPCSVLGLATGATMEPVYADVVHAVRAGTVSLSAVTTFNLDEYAGLPATHPGSYRSTMNALLFDHTDVDKRCCFIPDGMAADPDEEAFRYEAQIAEKGPVDLQLLGIGRNGHIGFNEPGSELASRTRLVDLHPSTQDANSSFFKDGVVPCQALTMGISTILAAKAIVVLATGAAKAEAVARSQADAFDPSCPASALSGHSQVYWVLDKAAASLLPNA